MKKDSLILLLAVAILLSISLPILCFNSHHDCHYDECLRIYYNGEVGMCVEKAIDELYNAIAILWYFSILGGLMIFDKRKNVIAPFVIMGLLIGLAFGGVFVDPSKLGFVVALLPALVIFITTVLIGDKDILRKNRNNDLK